MRGDPLVAALNAVVTLTGGMGQPQATDKVKEKLCGLWYFRQTGVRSGSLSVFICV